ncbi:hypothetical protein CWE04_11375 [Thomasclavelia cocleata]|uniref:Uncharacterized protein n=1 Tax=Thomasclavelia cocleata TaxID=69824 RepID=A0A1I0GDE9_9FIRM|nr:hypothetical protein [Thomasclavelia cocleata]MCR1959873.1 hypothetical protein [Thomasclavelia cocleata]NDO43221.1 hypothetical protein [Thomasclavelia cocleata]PJN79808.1 hypothetical protein CWE04_11375 [Thomasclavelia cocleata]SET69038.1 hypothetical protein SAMN04489758_12849 [Thomasclavelia cocleata]
MDYYLSPDNCYQRLEDEFIKYGKLIIAVDFDDTIYDFHRLGRTYTNVINLLKRWDRYAQIIIFTGNGVDKLSEIKSYCNRYGIPYDGINCNSMVKVNGRKIYANAYLDDRGGLPMVYDHLNTLIEKIEKGVI